MTAKHDVSYFVLMYNVRGNGEIDGIENTKNENKVGLRLALQVLQYYFFYQYLL